MVRRAVHILLLLVAGGAAQAQEPLWSAGQWHLQSVSGSVTGEGRYRYQETTLKSRFRETPRAALINGRIQLNADSYIWHPNFLFFDLTADVAPGMRADRFATIPDRTETLTREWLRLQADLFRQRSMSLSLFGDVHHHLTSREFTTNVEVVNRDLGATLSYRNGGPPFSVSVLDSRWEQNEIRTNRRFVNDRQSVRGRVEESLYGLDRHHLTASYDDFARRFGPDSHIRNRVTTVTLGNTLPFSRQRTSAWRSLVWLTSQNGSHPYDRVQIQEGVRVDLPAEFSASGDYRFSNAEQPGFRSRQNTLSSRLEHQLFLSLHSHLFYEYTAIDQLARDDRRHILGGGWTYRKRIPAGGRITLLFDRRRRDEHRDAAPEALRVVDESQRMEDGGIILLENPNIDPSTVVVTDPARLIVYMEGPDYLLILRGDFLEIQRVPGGQIEPGGTVLVSYVARRQMAYSFIMANTSAGVTLHLLQQLVEVYFRYSDQDFDNIDNGASRILKRISQRIAGGRLNWGGLSGGIEIDDLNSNIIPYRSTRGFITASRSLPARTHLHLSGDWRRYRILDPAETQTYVNLAATLRWVVSRRSRFDIRSNLRIQDGRALDLKLATVGAIYSLGFRQVRIRVGMDWYRRDFLDERTTYGGAHITLQRYF